MDKRAKTSRTETVEEFLKRGGLIRTIPNGGEYTSDNYTRPSAKAWRELTKDDVGSRMTTLKWLGDKHG